MYEDAATILTCREIESSGELTALPIAEVGHTSNMDFLMPHMENNDEDDAEVCIVYINLCLFVFIFIYTDIDIYMAHQQHGLLDAAHGK